MRREKKGIRSVKTVQCFVLLFAVFSGEMWQEIRVKRREGWKGDRE